MSDSEGSTPEATHVPGRSKRVCATHSAAVLRWFGFTLQAQAHRSGLLRCKSETIYGSDVSMRSSRSLPFLSS